MNIKAHLGFVLIDIDGILIPREPEDSMRSFGSTSTSTAGLNKDEEQCVKRHITEETVTNLLLLFVFKVILFPFFFSLCGTNFFLAFLQSLMQKCEAVLTSTLGSCSKVTYARPFLTQTL